MRHSVRRAIVLGGAGILLLQLPGAAAFGKPAAQCGVTKTQHVKHVLRASLVLLDGRLIIPFGRNDKPQTLSAVFRTTSCLLDPATTHLTVMLAPTSGEEGNNNFFEIPAKAVLSKIPVVSPKGDQVTVKVRIDPKALGAGTYRALISTSGRYTYTTSVKAVLTRSDARWQWPAVAVALGWLIGLAMAAGSVILGMTESSVTGAELKWFPRVIYLIAAVGVSAVAASAVFVDSYLNVDVFVLSFSSLRDLTIKTATVAAGGAVVGLLTKGILGRVPAAKR